MRGYWAELDFLLDAEAEAVGFLLARGLVGKCPDCGDYFGARPRKAHCSADCRRKQEKKRYYSRHKAERQKASRKWMRKTRKEIPDY